MDRLVPKRRKSSDRKECNEGIRALPSRKVCLLTRLTVPFTHEALSRRSWQGCDGVEAAGVARAEAASPASGLARMRAGAGGDPAGLAILRPGWLNMGRLRTDIGCPKRPCGRLSGHALRAALHRLWPSLENSFHPLARIRRIWIHACTRGKAKCRAVNSRASKVSALILASRAPLVTLVFQLQKLHSV